jgi:hypothetical protein
MGIPKTGSSIWSMPKSVKCASCSSTNVRPLYGKVMLTDGSKTMRSVGYFCMDCYESFVRYGMFRGRQSRIPHKFEWSRSTFQSVDRLLGRTKSNGVDRERGS